MHINIVALLLFVSFILTGCFKDQTTEPVSNKILNAGRKIVTGQSPRISPDGTKMVFGDYSGNLFICDSGGAGMIQLASSSSSASWSPDGKEIAYTKLLPGYGYHYKLLAYNLSSMGIRDLSPNDSSGGGGLIWSPLGDMIAMTVYGSPRSSLKIIKSDGSGTVLEKFVFGTFCWAPAGNQFIATIAYPDSGILYSSTPGSGIFSKIGVSDFYTHLMWLPDGNSIAYIGFGGYLTYFNLFSQLKTTDKSVRMPSSMMKSPDGSKIAYVVQESYGTADSPPVVSLYCVGNDAPVLSSTQVGLNFAWSPNAKEIYYEYNGWIYKTSIP